MRIGILSVYHVKRSYGVSLFVKCVFAKFVIKKLKNVAANNFFLRKEQHDGSNRSLVIDF